MNCEVPRKNVVPSVGQVWAAGKWAFVLIIPDNNEKSYRLLDLLSGEQLDSWNGLEVYNWRLYDEAL